MFKLIIKIYRKIIKKYKNLFFWVLRKICSAFGFNLVLYSSWSNIYLIFKKKKDKKYFGIKKNTYFNYNVFSQESDLRANFNNYWDEESTRIAVLVSLNKLFNKFDFFDLGANYGLYSLPFVNLDKVTSHLVVEPNPLLVTCLEKTFSKSKVKIISNAITDTSQKKKLLFNINPFQSGSSNLESPVTKSYPLSAVQMGVDGISYSDMFNKYKMEKNVIIKIDIEGTEINLLKDGLLDYLKNTYQNFVIMFEYIPKFYSKDQNDFIKKQLSNYYCIPLTNYNYRNEPKNKNYRKDFFLNDNVINRFYKTRYENGIEWFANEKQLVYSDLIIFSSQKLAKEAMNL
tara:strand:- start:25709 stop:26737 length:1029 start_codon:yes stop_codon:yes gene_type:complete